RRGTGIRCWHSPPASSSSGSHRSGAIDRADKESRDGKNRLTRTDRHRRDRGDLVGHDLAGDAHLPARRLPVVARPADRRAAWEPFFVVVRRVRRVAARAAHQTLSAVLRTDQNPTVNARYGYENE